MQAAEIVKEAKESSEEVVRQTMSIIDSVSEQFDSRSSRRLIESLKAQLAAAFTQRDDTPEISQDTPGVSLEQWQSPRGFRRRR